MRLSKRTLFLASVILVTIVVAASVAIYFALYYAQSSQKSSMDLCLVEIPNDSKFLTFTNYTSHGANVTYPNGTIHFFPDNACPQPVFAGLYGIISLIEKNSTFKKLENGSTFIFDADHGLLNGTTTECSPCHTYKDFEFYTWTNSTTTPSHPNGFGIGLSKIPLTIKGIEVVIPLNVSATCYTSCDGPYELSQMKMAYIHDNEINIPP